MTSKLSADGDLLSFPTRRSSDLAGPPGQHLAEVGLRRHTDQHARRVERHRGEGGHGGADVVAPVAYGHHDHARRSEEHTSELQPRLHHVCRLLLEKKNTEKDIPN